MSGQSTVEYILLLSVIMAITIGVLKSDRFKRFFGDNSVVFEAYRKTMEHSYRHGFAGNLDSKENKDERYSNVHESYYSNGDTHFFYTRDYGKK